MSFFRKRKKGSKKLTDQEIIVVEDPKIDKSALYGYHVPIGTWMGVRKVYNEEYWLNEVKTGNVRGFSIEGIFSPEMREDLAEQMTGDEKKLAEIKKLLNL